MSRYKLDPSQILLRRIIALAILSIARPAIGWEPSNADVKSGAAPLQLNSTELNESSGIAFSNVSPNCIWSHNDSGDTPRLIAFNEEGQLTGWLHLNDVKAVDWEDMDSYDDGGARILVADVGDNIAARQSVKIYLFNEPEPEKGTGVASFQTLTVRYEGGPRNCEAVTVDISNRRILLLSKSPLTATLHSVPLPPREDTPEGELQYEYTAKLLAKALPIPMATGMDLCPKTGDIWISSYLHALRFSLPEDGEIEAAVKQMGQLLELPKLRQVEAIAVTDQGRVWVSTEGLPAKVQRIRHSRK
ncbi:MAG: hypothetical protein AAF802_31395 [Planctomycetota bacterium]